MAVTGAVYTSRPQSLSTDSIVAYNAFAENFTSSNRNGNLTGHDVRGDSWEECFTWLYSMPGAYFQVGSVFLCLCFMSGGSSEIGAVYMHITSMIAFVGFIIWGTMDVCAPDVVAWSALLAGVNLFQALLKTMRSKRIQNLMDKDGLSHFYETRFAHFSVSPQLFAALVTCKGCSVTCLKKGEVYATEKKSLVDRLSYLLKGRMKVQSNGNFVHFIVANSFIDSPEWDANKRANASNIMYKVSIIADTDCTIISWKRKGLASTLSKNRVLKKVFNALTGKDVSEKLCSLNDRHINEKGFRYDIRLPCIISLTEEVERRKKLAAKSPPGTPDVDGRKHRHKRLGKTAAAKYANVLAAKLIARRSMRKAQGPMMVRREPLKPED